MATARRRRRRLRPASRGADGDTDGRTDSTAFGAAESGSRALPQGAVARARVRGRARASRGSGGLIGAPADAAAAARCLCHRWPILLLARQAVVRLLSWASQRMLAAAVAGDRQEAKLPADGGYAASGDRHRSGGHERCGWEGANMVMKR